MECLHRVKVVIFSYIVFNVPVHANATLSTVNHWFSVSEILSWVTQHSIEFLDFDGDTVSIHICLRSRPVDPDVVCECVILYAAMLKSDDLNDRKLRRRLTIWHILLLELSNLKISLCQLVTSIKILNT